jgi:mono/diheme cytochrome c family protein
MTWIRILMHARIRMSAVCFASVLICTLTVQAETRPDPLNTIGTGEELYHSACSSCHGADGKGSPQHRVGFALPVPDFTDCNFSSREPDADWIAIAHQGGPVRGFSEIMPAFGQALSLEDLSSILTHIRSFCGDGNWPPGELNLPRLLVTEKAYPEDEAVYSLSADVEGQGAVSNKVVYEKRFGARNQFELTVPFGWEEQEIARTGESWRGGLGDVALGVKRDLFHNAGTGTIFSATGEIVLPTGDREKGFGKGTTVFEPFVSFGQILPSELFFQSQAGFEFPADTDRARREGFWRFGLGRTFTAGPFGRSWSPMCEFLGAREFEEGEPVQWDAVPQMQVTLNRRQHIMLNVGVRLPLTESGIRDTELLFYLLWDWFDGGFFSGW